MLANYSRVELRSDSYCSEGVCSGDIGYVVEVYEDGHEVEFSRPDGNTKALVTVRPDEVALAEEQVQTPATTR